MSQGHFGNLCDTDNFGDPVVLYDSFEDRWFITDFAFKLDGSGNVNPQHASPVLRRVEDRRSGCRRLELLLDPGSRRPRRLSRSSASGRTASTCRRTCSATQRARRSPVRTSGRSTRRRCTRAHRAPRSSISPAPSPTSRCCPANARLQTGTPPAGTPEYFVSTEQFLNALSVYKFHVDWDKVSTSTFTGPDDPARAELLAERDAGQRVDARQRPRRPRRSGRWRRPSTRTSAAPSRSGSTHTVSRGRERDQRELQRATATTRPCAGTRLNVTGGTVAANVVQGATYDPDGANTYFRFMPSLAVDRAGDMAVGYTQVERHDESADQVRGPAGRRPGQHARPDRADADQWHRLAERQLRCSTCLGGATTAVWRWIPNGCTFWMTNEYYSSPVTQTSTTSPALARSPSRAAPRSAMARSPARVTDGTNPIPGATVSLGSGRRRRTAVEATRSASQPEPIPPRPLRLPASHRPRSPWFQSPSGGTATRNFTLTGTSAATTLAVAAATGSYGGTTNLSATLTSGEIPSPVSRCRSRSTELASATQARTRAAWQR